MSIKMLRRIPKSRYFILFYFFCANTIFLVAILSQMMYAMPPLRELRWEAQRTSLTLFEV